MSGLDRFRVRRCAKAGRMLRTIRHRGVTRTLLPDAVQHNAHARIPTPKHEGLYRYGRRHGQHSLTPCMREKASADKRGIFCLFVK